MICIGNFEDEIDLLKNIYEHGNYVYINPAENFTACTRSHFKRVVRKDKHGVYIVRARDSHEVLYIGKSGTLDDYGRFRKQDIPGRLTNIRGTENPNDQFQNLLQEKGPLIIEYIFLLVSKSPSFVEKALLQAYFNEFNRLPYKNKEL